MQPLLRVSSYQIMVSPPCLTLRCDSYALTYRQRLIGHIQLCPALLPRLEIGAQYQVDLYFNPDNSVSEGYHNFVLRVMSPGEQPRDLPILVAVTQSGVGDMVVHVSDIYTGTLNTANEIIRGVQNAYVRIEREAFPGQVVRTAYTDALGGPAHGGCAKWCVSGSSLRAGPP